MLRPAKSAAKPHATVPTVDAAKPEAPGSDAGAAVSHRPRRRPAASARSTQGPATGIWPRWRSCLITAAKIAAAIVLLPPFLNYVALTKEERALRPATGELYDVGWGQRLFLSCSGSGSPTVILDAPTGISSDAWRELAPSIARLTRVCVYDRAGLGFSERPAPPPLPPPQPNTDGGSEDGQHHQGAAAAAERRSQPYTVERMAEDLHRLVTQASQQPQPFVLVGAELGALVAKFYAHFYDGHVAAVVLIDPPVEQLFADRAWWEHWYEAVVPSAQALQLLAASGLSRLSLITGLMTPPPLEAGAATSESSDEESSDAAATFAARQKFLMCHPRHLKTAVDERYFLNESLAQTKILGKVKPFPANVSVTLATRRTYDAERAPQFDALWREAYGSAEATARNLGLPRATIAATLPQERPTLVYEGRVAKTLRGLIADAVRSARSRHAA